MSSTSPADLNAAAIIELIDSGAYPRDVVITFARGFVPLSQEEVVAVLAYLSSYDDAEVSAAARASLSDIPTHNVVTFAASDEADPRYLTLLASATNDPFILESLIRNRAFRDESVIDLARRADPAVQDVIVTNQQRIIRAPQILDALLDNPALTADVRRRALEVREEFFDKLARIQEMKEFQEAELADASYTPIADLLEAAMNEPDSAAPPPELLPSEKTGEKEMNLWARLQVMTVAQKVLLAFRGDKTTRSILIRERNKLVSTGVIRNPRITETEVENIAGSRMVEEEVLRIIGMRRDWMVKYPIMIALCRNPRAPLGVVLPLINRLTLRDLKGLKDDKGVPDVVRSSAKKLYDLRHKKS